MKLHARWIWLALIASLALGAPRGAAAQQNTENAVQSGATEHMIPMRDGVRLATAVYLPEGEGPWPVVLTRTPYDKSGRFAAGHGRYTSAGYAFVVQDCRGKFASEGDYFPFQSAREDGYDTVEWIAGRPWSNGKVGMSGASAMGITSNLAATADPPHLVAAFVIVAPQSMFSEATFIGGVFKEADVGNWMRRQGAGDQVADRKASVILDQEERDTDLVWSLKKIDIPIYNLGGWYDIFGIGNVSNFAYLQNKGSYGARGNQKLMMGPFGHGQLRGDLSYGEGGIGASMGEEIRWFDYWLKGVDNGIMDEPPVKYYHMASARKDAFSDKNGWRTGDNWPPVRTKSVRFYLTPEFELSSSRPEMDESKSTYDFDPSNPVPTVGGANLTLPLGPMDQREIGDRPDYLRFQTPVLTQDLTVTGRIHLDLFAETNAPDTDFMVKLVDVYPDGYEALILDAPLRARYRHGRELRKIRMMKPGKVVRMKVDLWATSNTFEKGHRLAVHISSSNSPRFEVNPNTGEEAGLETQEPQVARNSIVHDRRHPTALVLPVVVGEPMIADDSSRERRTADSAAE